MVFAMPDIRRVIAIISPIRAPVNFYRVAAIPIMIPLVDMRFGAGI
jgi:hypothetical protein